MRLKARKIIGEAWDFTQTNKKLTLLYAFVPSLLTTLAGIIYLTYLYYAFASSPLFGDWEQSFSMIVLSNVVQMLRDNFSTTFPLLIIAGVVVLLYILIPPLCEGALIQLIARKRNDQNIRSRDGIRYGLLNFLPLFEYSLFIRTFSLISVITWSAFILRYLGWDGLTTFSPVLVVYALAGIIMTILFTYSEFFIVIDGRRVIESLSKSSTLVVTHLEETILLLILMLIISVRILLQIIFVLLIPAAMLGIMYIFASATIPLFAVGIAAVVGVILLYIAAYLSATIHVFAASVWTFTFLELTAQKEPSPREKG